jgi:hypothetical protein
MKAAMRSSSVRVINVPVGLEGEPSSNPLVRGPHVARTISSVGWKPLFAETGRIFATPSNARTKWR